MLLLLGDATVAAWLPRLSENDLATSTILWAQQEDFVKRDYGRLVPTEKGKKAARAHARGVGLEIRSYVPRTYYSADRMRKGGKSGARW